MQTVNCILGPKQDAPLWLLYAALTSNITVTMFLVEVTAVWRYIYVGTIKLVLKLFCLIMWWFCCILNQACFIGLNQFWVALKGYMQIRCIDVSFVIQEHFSVNVQSNKKNQSFLGKAFYLLLV